MSDLRGNSVPARVSFGSTGKIIGVIAVAAAATALGFYGYQTGQFKTTPKPVVSNAQLPTTGAPSGTAQ